MMKTPKGLRLHIAIFGRRNVGKSTLLNALTEQNVSIVSDVAGTTTDPVEKPLELLPLGPVLFIDTAGIDDKGGLGALRIEKTKKIFDRADFALLVVEAECFGKYEEDIVSQLDAKKIPFIVVVNKTDICIPSKSFVKKLGNYKYLLCSSLSGDGIPDLKKMLIANVPDDWINPPTLAGDLIETGRSAVLVIPIDLEAPKGRLILPQVQVIRELLDNDCIAVVVKERELGCAIDNMSEKPKIVITDSQAVLKVCADVPYDIKVTTFSILFARYKGDLRTFVDGVFTFDDLKDGDKVLIGEACSHHAIADDIGTVKIPRWVRQYTGKNIIFEKYSGHDFPENLKEYRLIVHCGSCMINRREVLNRIVQAKSQGVPITNYGVAISYLQGVLKRAVEPFPSVSYLINQRK